MRNKNENKLGEPMTQKSVNAFHPSTHGVMAPLSFVQTGLHKGPEHTSEPSPVVLKKSQSVGLSKVNDEYFEFVMFRVAYCQMITFDAINALSGGWAELN